MEYQWTTEEGVAIPHYPDTTRQDLECRCVLSVPRLLCIQKQYPRSCGITSLTSVYNYLYSRLGESVSPTEAPHRPPFTQEEIMTVLGFSPPFGDIPWGSFTGNVTLIRWFNALNRHFGYTGRAYILYKVHGIGSTTHLYEDDRQALKAVKSALCNPYCALIYHCYNHYMVPIGYQEIPLDQSDCLRPNVPVENTAATIFIGEVSRGKGEAMYARKWSDIVKDLSCCGDKYFNIRHPELGIQKKEKKSESATEQSRKKRAKILVDSDDENEEEDKESRDCSSPSEGGDITADCVSENSHREGKKQRCTRKKAKQKCGQGEEGEEKKARGDSTNEALSSAFDDPPPPLGSLPPLPVERAGLTSPFPSLSTSLKARRVENEMEDSFSDSRPSRGMDPSGDHRSLSTPISDVPASLSGLAPPPPTRTTMECTAVDTVLLRSPRSQSIRKKKGNLHCIICFRNDEMAEEEEGEEGMESIPE